VPDHVDLCRASFATHALDVCAEARRQLQSRN
jgi:hypothetical protein